MITVITVTTGREFYLHKCVRAIIDSNLKEIELNKQYTIIARAILGWRPKGTYDSSFRHE